VPKRLYAKNKTELHRLIGISRPALERLFKRGDYPPQVPGQGWNIEQWKRYSRENIATWNRREKSSGNGHQPRSSVIELEEAKIARQNIEAQRAQFDLDVKRGKYSPRTETNERVMRNFNLLVREGDKAFRHELPPRLEGLSAGQIAKVLGRRWDEIRDRVAKELDGGNGPNGH
jgi:hypothetical protein